MGRRKKKTRAGQLSYTIGASGTYYQDIWIRDPTRVVSMEDYDSSGECTIPEPMNQQTILQTLRTMATDPFYTFRGYWELAKEQELEQVAREVLSKKQEKKNENLEIKGKYRERIKELTDEITALKYENEQLKKKYEHSTH